MMMNAAHAEARPACTRATSTPETRSLSAVVSRKLPSEVVCFHRRASRPSKKSVRAANANSTAATGIAQDSSDRRSDDQRHHDRGERDAQVRDEREERGGASSAVVTAVRRIVAATVPQHARAGARPHLRPCSRTPGRASASRRAAPVSVARTASFTAATAGALIESSVTPSPISSSGVAGVSRELAADAHPAAVDLRALHGRPDQAQHRRVQRVVEGRHVLVPAVGGQRCTASGRSCRSRRSPRARRARRRSGPRRAPRS